MDDLTDDAPPLPRLPPCLPCVVAGVTCSLTTRPYARGYAKDTVHVGQRTPVAAAGAIELDLPVGAGEDLFYNFFDMEDLGEAACRQLQDDAWRLLLTAAARGSADAPGLAACPVQCVRCAVRGATCLQQTADLTTGQIAGDVAWFASSGAPPLSLLPQHATVLQGEPQRGPDACTAPAKAPRHARSRVAPQLEAVFCRDASVPAATVLAQAHRLLGQIADSRPHARPLRPATALEVTRALPRRSPLNAYAQRGIATLPVRRQHDARVASSDLTIT